MYRLRGLFLFVLVIFILLLIPVIALIIGTSYFPQLGKPTFTFLSLLRMPLTTTLVENTLEFAIVSAAITTVIATTYAWFVARTDIPGKRFFELLPILGLATPQIINALAWSFLFNPNSGLGNQVLTFIFGKNAPVFNIDTMGGLIFVQAVANVPIVYLLTVAALKSVDSSLEEASRISGRGIFRTFVQVTFPIIWPAVFSAFVLAIIGGINNFDYTFILGTPSRIRFLTTQIYFYAAERVPPAYGDAGYLSVIYVVITMVAVGVYIWSTRKAFKFQVITGRSNAENVQRLGGFRFVGFVYCIAIVFLQFLLPFLALVLISFTNAFSATLTRIHFTGLVAFNTALKIQFLFPSINITLEFGIIAAVVTTLIAALLSYVALRSRSLTGRLTEYVSSIPLAFPPLVYGVSLFWTFLLIPGANLLYGTIWPLVISLVFIRLPFATRIISANMVQISYDLEDASQVAGAKFRRTFSRVLLPLVKEGIFNSLMYTFVDSLKELGGVVLLTTAGSYTFTTLLLNYYETPGAQFNTIAAASVLYVVIIAAVIVIASIIRYLLTRRSKAKPIPQSNEKPS